MSDLFHCAKKKIVVEKPIHEKLSRYPNLPVKKENIKNLVDTDSSSSETSDSSSSEENFVPLETVPEEKVSVDHDFPRYPLCKTLYGLKWVDSFYLTCISVFRELGNHTSQMYLRKRLSKSKETGLNITLHQLIPNLAWSNEDEEWRVQEFTEGDFCVAVKDLEEFIQWAQLRTRKPLIEKQRMFRKFNIELSEDKVKDIKVPIENEVLDFLQRCLPFKMEYQYRVGKYKLDAFIPRLRIGIQIDEHGHQNYVADEEKEYNEVVRDNNIVCIRFNPHEKYMDENPAMELVRRVWERTLSPDFSTFREKYKLT
jgi:very-short-patch-repair endonuclease